MQALNALNRHLFRIILLALFLGGVASAWSSSPVFTVTPNTISNTYLGPVTLQVTGLTSGDTVVIQKFIDFNGNGVVDAGDALWQQFKLTDGQNTVFTNGSILVTNAYIPGDTDGTANGQISATLYPALDFSQIIIAKYLFVMSSPGGHFAPVTNSFSVTNFPFAQSISGNVVSNTTPLPNAAVILFEPGSGGSLNPLGGVVANNSGAYSIQAPPGAYLLAAYKSNYVMNLAAAPGVNLQAGLPLTTNVPLMMATQTISGTVEDSVNPGIGVAGYLVPVESTNSLLAFGFTDTNGNFTAHVTASKWKLQGNASSLLVKGYLTPQNKISVSTLAGSVSGVTLALPHETAIIYGQITDPSSHPLAAIDVYTSDNGGTNEADCYSLNTGYFFAPAIASANDPWQIQYGGSTANYVFSQASLDMNGGTNLSAGQAVLQNFSGILATNLISGNVQTSGGSPFSNLGVNASQTINGIYYNSHADTDGNGNYSLPVANGYAWNVNVNCGNGGDGLGNFGSYICPPTQSISINNNNGTANFVISNCAGVQIFTSSLPTAQVGNYYDNFLSGSTCNGNYNWSVVDPQNFPSDLTFNSNGEIFGTPVTGGNYSFTVQLSDGSGNTTTQLISLTVNGSAPLQINTGLVLPNATNGLAYNFTFSASGGTPPYSWSIPNYSLSLPPNLNFSTNGVVSGTPSTTVGMPNYFSVTVTDSQLNSVTVDGFTLYVVNPPLAPLIITNVFLPSGTVGAPYNVQLGAVGGLSPYNWSVALGSLNPPSGLVLDSSGLISGTPTNSKVGVFKVQVTDSASDVTNKVLSITIANKPVLSVPSWQTNQFRMLLTGASNQNYTVQTTTNVNATSWATLYVTNNPVANAFQVPDAHATNATHYYRVLVGP